MSIQSEIERINGNVASAYSVLSAKGAAMPSLLNTANLASAIESIPINAEAMSIETIWEICGYEPPVVPDEYKQLNYIQSSGAQYIVTGVMPNQDTRIVMDFQVLSSTSVSFVFGSRVGFQKSVYELFLNGNNTGMYDGYINSAYGFMLKDVGRHYLDKNKNVTTLDGNVYTHTYSSFQSAYNMVLFSANVGGSVESRGAVMRLYSCQIYEGETLVRDFVPCINPDGAYGLYDLVNAQFYANAGSGTFTGA